MDGSHEQPEESQPMTGAAASRKASESRVYDSAALRVPFIHELTELGRYRFLLWNLVLRDLRVRYKRSIMGFLWAMVNPLLTMMVLLAVFTRLFRFDVEHYPIYILAGLLVWNLFARGTSIAMRSVIDNAGVRNKIYVPASVFVAAAIGSALVNLLFALFPMLALALFSGVAPTLAWLYLPVPILQTTLLAFGVGVLIAALAVFFADMLDIYEVLLGAFFYLTPIIYPVSILPEVLRRLERLNLVFAFIDGFRSPLLLGRIPDLGDIVLTTCAALAITIVGWTLFTRLLDQFAYRA
jgi:ABC-2 type transport system permease protein